jgi:hypothetical protein
LALSIALLEIAVDGFLHALTQQTPAVARQQRIPIRAPDDLDDVPAGAAEHRFELLDDLAVAAYRAIEALQIAVDYEDQVVQPLTGGQRQRSQRLGLVHLAVAEEGPHFAPAGVQNVPMVQIAHKPRLGDGHHRGQSHGHGRELPETRHQPGVRVGSQALAIRRTIGWVAHWMEMMSDPQEKIGHPRQIFKKELRRDYVRIEQRR